MVKSDVTFDFTNGSKVVLHNQHTELWKVTVVDTGYETSTGGRIKRAKDYIGYEPFLMTYGDAVRDVNITDLVQFQRIMEKMVIIVFDK